MGKGIVTSESEKNVASVAFADFSLSLSLSLSGTQRRGRDVHTSLESSVKEETCVFQAAAADLAKLWCDCKTSFAVKQRPCVAVACARLDCALQQAAVACVARGDDLSVRSLIAARRAALRDDPDALHAAAADALFERALELAVKVAQGRHCDARDCVDFYRILVCFVRMGRRAFVW